MRKTRSDGRTGDSLEALSRPGALHACKCMRQTIPKRLPRVGGIADRGRYCLPAPKAMVQEMRLKAIALTEQRHQR